MLQRMKYLWKALCCEMSSFLHNICQQIQRYYLFPKWVDLFSFTNHTVKAREGLYSWGGKWEHSINGLLKWSSQLLPSWASISQYFNTSCLAADALCWASWFEAILTEDHLETFTSLKSTLHYKQPSLCLQKKIMLFGNGIDCVLALGKELNNVLERT